MPTGYTSTLAEKEQSFKDFALQCLRAMGACVTMRDKPFNTPIPDEFKPSDYHQKELEKAIKELKDFEAMTTERRKDQYQQYVIDTLARKRQHNDRVGAQKARYENMLARVNEWEPPTSDHIGFKNFMREQLESSIDGDCNFETDASVPPFKVWEINKITNLKWDIEYHTKHNAEEIERCKKRTEYIQAVKKSLNTIG